MRFPESDYEEYARLIGDQPAEALPGNPTGETNRQAGPSALGRQNLSGALQGLGDLRNGRPATSATSSPRMPPRSALQREDGAHGMADANIESGREAREHGVAPADEAPSPFDFPSTPSEGWDTWSWPGEPAEHHEVGGHASPARPSASEQIFRGLPNSSRLPLRSAAQREDRASLRAADSRSSHEGTPPAKAAAYTSEELIRRVAASAMHAEETTLERAAAAGCLVPYPDDEPLIERMAGALRKSGVPVSTSDHKKYALRRFSAWLRLVHKDAMHGRLFSEELMLDAWKFHRVGGGDHTTAALRDLRQVVSRPSGTVQVVRTSSRLLRAIPEVDQWIIEQAFPPSDVKHINGDPRKNLLAFSEWLHQRDERSPGLADPDYLHSSELTAAAQDFAKTGAMYANKTNPALKRLRAFDLGKNAEVKRRRTGLRLPEADQRLITQYRHISEASSLAANTSGKTYSHGGTKYAKYAGGARAFSEWLQGENMEGIASRLHEPSLDIDLECFNGEGKERAQTRYVKVALRAMRAMFPINSPEAALGRIGSEQFVKALGFLATPGMNMADLTQRIERAESDMSMFFDIHSDTGLTGAGQLFVETLDGRLRQVADSNIALRRQGLEQGFVRAGQTPAHEPPSPFELPATPSEGWETWSWQGEPAGQPDVTGPALSPRPAVSDSTFGGLSSLGALSYSQDGGRDFDPNTPQEEVSGPKSPLWPTASDAIFEESPNPAQLPQRPNLQRGDSSRSMRYTPDPHAGAASLHAGQIEGQVPSPFELPATPSEGWETWSWQGEPAGHQEVTGPALSQQPAVFSPAMSTGGLPSLHELATGPLTETPAADVGIASGQGLNCLLDSVLQLVSNTRRDGSMAQPQIQQLQQDAQVLRDNLVSIGMVGSQGQIDLYGANGVGALLATSFGVRIQAIEARANGDLIAHPTLGREGRLVHILHTPGHFEPLWPRQD